ncbi:MAG TPA: sulfotransferase [Anaerolineales bacterium]
MGKGPIFIGGTDRSGKTTLRAFLVSHPNISIPANGSNMWSYFYGQFGDLSQAENFERCLDALMHYKHALYLKPDPDRIRHEFWQGTPTYARLFALFHEHLAEREGKPRWGDQTGLIERYADQIFEAYPNAKMIQMIRDPRDRYQASLTLWPKGKGRAGGATARWLYSTSLAIRNLRRYPNRYMIVRYETLVRDTEQTLREVCTFLDEDFIPSMITMDGDLDRRSRLTQGLNIKPDTNPLTPDFIGLYHQAVPQKEIAFIQGIAGKQMKAIGYSLDAISFSLSDRIRYILLDWPLNMLRMLAWLSLEIAHHNFPAQFGRKLSSNMITPRKHQNNKVNARAT